MKSLRLLLAMTFFFSGYLSAQGASKTPYRLSVGEKLSLEGLDVRLTKVSDSRCPQEVQCIWEGLVRVTVELSDLTGIVKEGVLTLHLGESDTVEFNGYRISISDVKPWPQVGDVTEKAVWLAIEPSL